MTKYLRTKQERQRAILEDSDDMFYFEHQDTDDVDEFRDGIEQNLFQLNYLGRDYVLEYWIDINNAANEFGIDVDFLGAVIHAENARGWYDFNSTLLSSSMRPGNIQEIWEELIPGSDFTDPQDNIRIAAKLISQIRKRLDNPYPEDIYALYNGLAHDRTYENAQTKSTPYFVRAVMEDRAWEVPGWSLSSRPSDRLFNQYGQADLRAVMTGQTTRMQVRNIQQHLKDLGLGTTVSGAIDSRTRRAAQAFRTGAEQGFFEKPADAADRRTVPPSRQDAPVSPVPDRRGSLDRPGGAEETDLASLGGIARHEPAGLHAGAPGRDLHPVDPDAPDRFPTPDGIANADRSGPGVDAGTPAPHEPPPREPVHRSLDGDPSYEAAKRNGFYNIGRIREEHARKRAQDLVAKPLDEAPETREPDYAPEILSFIRLKYRRKREKIDPEERWLRMMDRLQESFYRYNNPPPEEPEPPRPQPRPRRPRKPKEPVMVLPAAIFEGRPVPPNVLTFGPGAPGRRAPGPADTASTDAPATPGRAAPPPDPVPPRFRRP